MLSDYTRAAVTQRLIDGQVREKLLQIEQDKAFNTCASSYTADSQYPDHQIPFVEKHIAYLMKNPKVDFDQYLSNLRLMLKIRQ